MSEEKRLLDFYGEECPHCQKMMPTVEEVEKELGVKVEKLEIWHNEENAKMMQEYDKGLCGGVPFFYNTASGEFICGEADKEKLKAWAKKDK